MSNRWSMSHDRQLMQLARTSLSAEQIAAKMKAKPETVNKAAKRLGVKLPPIVRKANGRRKMKAK